ncbi:hypothetical protein SSX86_019982 [Deinandra increscens subsp. villosa]|uniref:RRM domain-containing protein n=1 Tax=Deinandra increscens subsp. villosa TaxID=3103831 RepID=A0AAP0CYY3_9ASTR
MHRRRSISVRSLRRGRDHRHHEDFLRDRDWRSGQRHASRVRDGRAGQNFGSRERDGRASSDFDSHGYEHRGPTTQFSNTNFERFSHGEFDKYGIFHEYGYDVHEEDGKGDWQRVTYRKDKYRTNSPSIRQEVPFKARDSRWDDVNKWSNTIFVTNFPPDVTKKGIYDRLGKIGKVVDVYIPGRVSEVGKRFAFVRFAKSLDISDLIYKIRNTWIGSFRLFADVSKFKRGEVPYHKEQGDKVMDDSKKMDAGEDPLGKKKEFFNDPPKVVKEKVWQPKVVFASVPEINKEACSSGSNDNNNIPKAISTGKAGSSSFAGASDDGKALEDDVSSEEEDSDVNSVLDDSRDNNFFASYDYIWDNVNGEVNDENAHVGPVGVDEGIDVVNTATNSVFHADEATSKKATNSDPFGIMDYINNFELNKEYSLSLSVPPGFNRIDNVDDGVVNKTDIAGVHGNDPPSHVHLAADHVECKLKENSEEQQNSSKASSSNNGEQQNSSVNGGSLCRSNPVIRKEGDAPGFTNATFSGLSSKQGGIWSLHDFECYMVIIYAPQASRAKRDLWSLISLFMLSHPGSYFIFGDFNVSRFEYERLGVAFNRAEADCFNDFIDSHDLVDVNLGGFKFTRISSNGLQQSKLDRFLVSASICSRFSGLEGLVLSNKVADHRPILLRIRDKDFGPIPFKFFNFWINLEGYEATVKQGWDDPCHLAHSNCFIRFKEKLKCVKNLLKAWNKDRRNLENGSYIALKANLEKIELVMEEGLNLVNLNKEKCNILDEITCLDRRHHLETSQKIKSNWVIEGDENSKFFHALLKKRRRVNSVRGIKVDVSTLSRSLI